MISSFEPLVGQAESGIKGSHMANTPRSLLPLWDYGWCDYARLAIPKRKMATEVIRDYMRSEAFGTSFVDPSLGDGQELYHGPFHRALISETDFELVSPQRFEELFEAIRYIEVEPVSDIQWLQVRKLVSEIHDRNSWFFRLRLTEDDFDRHHEFGNILGVFREFICASPDSDFAERLVFGYD